MFLSNCSLQAFNRAGMFTVATSWAFLVDVTPPVVGHVFDGPVINGTDNDNDYTRSHDTLQAHWKGFHDQHTSIKEYFITAGSCKMCDDVLVKQPIGVREGTFYSYILISLVLVENI